MPKIRYIKMYNFVWKPAILKSIGWGRTIGDHKSIIILMYDYQS